MPDAQASSYDPTAERLLAEKREREARVFSRPERITYWVASVGFAACALALLATGRDASLPRPWVAMLLLVSYAAASRLDFEVGSISAIPTELVLVEMLFLLPPTQVPLWVAAGLVLGQLPEYTLRIIPVERMLVAVGSSWFALGPALVFELLRPTAAPSLRCAAALALALGSQFAFDLIATAVREWTALRVPPRHLIAPAALAFVIDLVLAPLGLLAAIGVRLGSTALLLPLPLLFVIGLSARQRQRQVDQALELSSAYRGTAVLLGDVVEADDEYTGAHSRDVLELALAVCDELRLDPRSRLNAEFAALLHDVGKIKTPAEIINKSGPLTPEERAIINMHTIEGQRMLKRVGGRLAEVGTIVRSCHERWDGCGYPDGLAGPEIPLVARIVGCCDAFSAMTTHRSYRRALSVADALDELEACAGSQFDPDVVAALTELIRSGRAGLQRKPELVALESPQGARASA